MIYYLFCGCKSSNILRGKKIRGINVVYFSPKTHVKKEIHPILLLLMSSRGINYVIKKIQTVDENGIASKMGPPLTHPITI